MLKNNRYARFFFIVMSGTLSIYTGTLIYRTKSSSYHRIDRFAHKNPALPSYNIALLLPVDTVPIQEIKRGIKLTLNQSHRRFSLSSFYNNQNLMLLRAQIEKIISENYHIIVAIGAQAAQLAKEIVEKRDKHIPVIYSNLSTIAQTNLTSGNVTGIRINDRNMEKQLDALCSVKPNISSLCFVYNPYVHTLSEQVKELSALCKKRGIRTSQLEVFAANEVNVKLSGYLAHHGAGIDTIMILRDHATVSAISTLIKLCSQYSITLFASDLYSVDQGAAIGYSSDDYDYGLLAGHLVRLVAAENLCAHRIEPVVVNESNLCKLKINSFSMKKQGLNLMPKDMAHLKNVTYVRH